MKLSHQRMWQKQEPNVKQHFRLATMLLEPYVENNIHYKNVDVLQELLFTSIVNIL